MSLLSRPCTAPDCRRRTPRERPARPPARPMQNTLKFSVWRISSAPKPSFARDRPNGHYHLLCRPWSGSAISSILAPATTFSGLLQELIQQVVDGRLPENLRTPPARVRGMQASPLRRRIRGGNVPLSARFQPMVRILACLHHARSSHCLPEFDQIAPRRRARAANRAQNRIQAGSALSGRRSLAGKMQRPSRQFARSSDLQAAAHCRQVKPQRLHLLPSTAADNRPRADPGSGRRLRAPRSIRLGLCIQDASIGSEIPLHALASSRTNRTRPACPAARRQSGQQTTWHRSARSTIPGFRRSNGRRRPHRDQPEPPDALVLLVLEAVRARQGANAGRVPVPAPAGAIKTVNDSPALPERAFDSTESPALMGCLRNPWREPRRRQLDYCNRPGTAQRRRATGASPCSGPVQPGSGSEKKASILAEPGTSAASMRQETSLIRPSRCSVAIQPSQRSKGTVARKRSRPGPSS